MSLKSWIKKLLVVVIFTSATSLASAQILITGFGTGQVTSPSGSFSFTINATNTNLVGVDNNSFFAEVSPVNISGFLSAVSLVGVFNSGSATSNFQIQLFDADGDSLLYQGNWTSFAVGSPTTVTLPFFGSDLSGGGTFDNIVTQIGLATGGSGLGSINFTADNLSAVPEPSSAALLALAAAGCLLRWRRRQTA